MKRPLLLAFLERARKQLMSVGVLAILGAIGLWGHRNHWQFAPSPALGDALGPEVGVGDRESRRDRRRENIVEPNGAAAAHKAIGQSLGDANRICFPSPKSVRDIGIETVLPERRAVSQEVSAAGVVSYEPSRIAQLSARVPGTVWRVEKQVGQTVRAGDALAIIDSLAVGEAKANLLHSIADVQLLQTTYERLLSVDTGAIPARQIAEAKTQLRKARVDLFNAQQALISLGLPVDLDQCQSLPETELHERVKFLGLPHSIVAQLDPNATAASLLPIFAPFDGLVIGRDLALGETVATTGRHFEIADVSKMWIVLNVREQDADDLELGQQITFRAGKSSVTCPLSWMSTAVDEKTRTIEVRGETDNPEVMNSAGQPTGKRLLRANLFGVAQIQVRNSPSALVVPTQAVQRHGAAHVVFVPIDDLSFEARSVRVGIVGGEFTEIVEGLSSSEMVVSRGSHIFKAQLQRTAARPP